MSENNIKIWEPDNNFYSTHVTFTSVNNIKTLSSCLSTIGINYFTFDRTYKDNSHIRLTNAGEWITHYYNKKLYDSAIFEQSPKLFNDGYVFWSWLKREPIYSEASLFNIDHGLTITQPHNNYCDFYHFGTSCDNPIPTSQLIANLPYLYQFIALFKEKAYKLIIEAENTRFILPITALTEINLKDIAHPDVKILDIYQNNEIRRLHLGDEFENCYLTNQEIKILAHLKCGKKVHEVAGYLYISERTAETHLNNIKNKLKCKTMFELGGITNSLGIHNIYPIKINK
jgi:hypothetical protein